jgi:hypothetical protein
VILQAVERGLGNRTPGFHLDDRERLRIVYWEVPQHQQVQGGIQGRIHRERGADEQYD